MMFCSSISTGGSSYEIRDFKVFFGNQYLPDARWVDFKDLGQGYGRDGNHVYFMGQIVTDAHPFSFQVIGNTYAKDYQHVFQYGQIIEHLQPQFFQPPVAQQAPSNPVQMSLPVGGESTAMPSYRVQNFKVFFGEEYLPSARWIDFTNLGQGYGKDIHHVFYLGHIINDANSFSFEVLTKGYAKDKNHVFYNGHIVPGLKPFGFQAPSD